MSKFVSGLFISILSDLQLLKIIVHVLKYLAQKSTNNIDNEIVAIIEKEIDSLSK